MDRSQTIPQRRRDDEAAIPLGGSGDARGRGAWHERRRAGVVPRPTALAEIADVLVVGAGFGGLATALRLAEGGAKVVLCESLGYPGGCASTFEHRGFRFEAGATLFSGLGEGQLFRRWIEHHQLDVTVDWLDPVIELRTPSWQLPIARRSGSLEAALAALPGAPRQRLRTFFAEQRRVADVLWSVLDDPTLLPPFDFRTWCRHAGRLARYLPLARVVGRPLAAVVERHGLRGFEPLRVALDALCQITIQCNAAEAEAPLALATLDYPTRGTAHVRGGIGELAWALVGAIRRAGGQVRFLERVRGLEREGEGFRITTRHGIFRARAVVANVLPKALDSLMEGDLAAQASRDRGLERLGQQVEAGWGACMLYRVVRPPKGDNGWPRHLELVADPTRPLVAGNHVFASFSGRDEGHRAPPPYRTLTVSTHVDLARLHALDPMAQVREVAEVQQRMRQTLDSLAPEWSEEVLFETTASPRTFERFTGRPGGFVGGVPRRAGLAGYREILRRPLASIPGLYPVGDSIFPGQSTLATALGGVKTAERILRRLG